MKIVTIDFSNVNNYRQIHGIVKESFQIGVEGFPDFYGENVDALWDCLTGFIETPVNIVVKGSTKTAKNLAHEIDLVIGVLLRAAKEDWIDIDVTIVD